VAILAPEDGQRKTLTPDPGPLQPTSVGGAMNAFMNSLGGQLRVRYEAQGRPSFYKVMLPVNGVVKPSGVLDTATATAAALAQKARDAAAAAAAKLKAAAAIIPQGIPPIAKIPALPPIAKLPAPLPKPSPAIPGRPGGTPQAAGAAGGGILLLVALALLSGTRRR